MWRSTPCAQVWCRKPKTGPEQIYLGDEKFINEMSLLATQISTGSGTSVNGSCREIPNAQRRAQSMALEAFERQHPNNRNAAIQGGYTMAQLAQHFQLHYTSVSRMVKLI